MTRRSRPADPKALQEYDYSAHHRPGPRMAKKRTHYGPQTSGESRVLRSRVRISSWRRPSPSGR
jgi:hypothetical protein